MCILAVLLNTNSYRNTKKVQLMFFWSPLAAAVLANIVYFVLAPKATSAGASGFDYAVMGLTIMVAVFGITSAVRSVGFKSYFSSAKHRINFLINALFAVTLVAFIVLASAVFLGVGGRRRCLRSRIQLDLRIVLYYFLLLVFPVLFDPRLKSEQDTLGLSRVFKNFRTAIRRTEQAITSVWH
jgi:hypothetical protein